MKLFSCFSIVFLLMAHLVFAQPGTVIQQFNAPITHLADLAWDGNYLYLLGMTDHNIYQIDPTNGQVLGSVSTGISGALGLTYCHGYFWISVIQGNTIKKLDASGNVLKTISIPAAQNIGMEWDGTAFRIADSGSPDEKILQVDSTGQLLGSFLFPGDSPFGLTWDGNMIWCANNNMGGSAIIYQLDPVDGTICCSFPCPNGGGSANGLTWDGQYLWIADNTNNLIYQVEGNPIPQFGVIEGWVKDAATGRGIGFVPVLNTHTDTSGYFLADSLTPGMYSIRFQAPGFQSDSVQVEPGAVDTVHEWMQPVGEPFLIQLLEEDNDEWTLRTYRDMSWRYYEFPLGLFRGSGTDFLDTPVKRFRLKPVSAGDVPGAHESTEWVDHIHLGPILIDDFEDGDVSDWSIMVAYNGSHLELQTSADTPDASLYSMKMIHGNFIGQPVEGWGYKQYIPGLNVFPQDTLRLWLKGTPEYPANEDPLSYYPMHNGDYWQYRTVYSGGMLADTTYQTAEVLGDTLMPNGKECKWLFHTSVGDTQPVLPYHTAQRIDTATGNVYLYQMNTQDEVLVDSLNAQVGDSFTVGNQTLVFRSWKPDTVLGEATFTKEFVSQQEARYLSKGFGRTARVWGMPDTVHTTLVYAIIEGVEYGEPVVGIKPHEQQILSTLMLEQNYPNPFNPKTVISYRLAVGSEVELTIYNLLGQKITTLVNARQPAGTYQVQWDGRNSAGQQVASGVYIYRLQSGNQAISRKMLLSR